MIIARAPLRISFVGGGTDLPDFYKKTPGKVISATIDKYTFVAINPAPLLKGIHARYSINETVSDPKKLKNDRIRETLLKFHIKDNMEIGVFSHLQVGTGLGGSSSFTVALIKALSSYTGKRMDKEELAQAACEIEMNALSEPIGKQDQYAAAFGGFNTFQFNPDGSVDTDPLLLDYKTRIDLENHIVVFFTGITRTAKSILSEQKSKTGSNTKSLKSLANLVDIFRKKLSQGNFKEMGALLHENWLIKKTLAGKISNEQLDALYTAGIESGSWGGKVLGAGGGGCIMFFIHPGKKEELRFKVTEKAKLLGLKGFKEVPVKFVHSGAEIMTNAYNG
jgi:D-glycero-alpha-D-manno-heptose-7-phosphate kinase